MTKPSYIAMGINNIWHPPVTSCWACKMFSGVAADYIYVMLRGVYDGVTYGALSLITRFMGPTWGPSEADRAQVGPMLAPWTLLSGMLPLMSSLFQVIKGYCQISSILYYKPIAYDHIDLLADIAFYQRSFITRHEKDLLCSGLLSHAFTQYLKQKSVAC